MFHQHTKCRACGGTELVLVLDLGAQPLANDFRKPGEECAGMAPLKVLFCNTCTLAQLSVVVDPAVLYSRYSYVTSKSDMMKAHFEQIMGDILGECDSDPKTLLEIGSNDGTFLKFASHKFDDVRGFEPAENLALSSNLQGIPTTPRLFTHANAIELAAMPFKADVIVARHVFCHVDDWHEFIKGLESISHKDTLVFIEVPHVLDMFRNNSFDQIYHEHLSYMSTTAMEHLLQPTKFRVCKVNHYPIHGGAVGYMLKMGNRKLLKPQCETELFDQWIDLYHEMQRNTHLLDELLVSLRRTSKTVCGFGASAKATVWIHTCGFTRKDIAFVCDSTPEKQGCLIPGTDIPIVPESYLQTEWLEDLGYGRGQRKINAPNYAVLFAWNYGREIMGKFKAFTDNCGKWIIPCPKVKVLP